MDRVLAGRYELEAPLGRGGSGEVWRGTDMATHKPVAIKLVELSQIDDATRLAETIGRFRREASVVSGLRHPNIIGALDAGRIGNQLFMVMELAPGISLAAMMDERGARGMGLFPVSSVLRIAEQVCVGLAAAHAAGIVHRDIKPSNLMVTPSLGVKIIDFGIARLIEENAPRLTLPAQTVGTIAYMSPEQAQGIDVDGRSDLYSLGCVLYQLLSGHPPFFSTLPSALLMMQVMDRAVPLGDIRSDLPAELCKLVSDLMEKDRGDRPATAEQVVAQIMDLRRMFGDEVPEFEADRQTIRTSELEIASAQGLTRFDDMAGDLTREPARSTVLTPGRMAQLSGELALAADTKTSGQASRSSTPFESAYQAFALHPPGVPGQTGPLGSAPQGAARTSAGTAAGTFIPPWPVTPPRRRSAWPGVLVSLIIAAVLAGGAAYYWLHVREAFKITNVAVTASNAKLGVGCNGTADLVGTITTNDHSGTIDYEWVLNGAKQGEREVSAPAGDSAVPVTMAWNFIGKGTSSMVAELEILNSQPVAKSTLTIPYSCRA
jgi:eukaryotic-like serine/threonine-protein kinase